MKEANLKKALRWMKENPEDALDLALQVNSEVGGCEWAISYSIKDLADSMSAYDLARAIIYGDVFNVSDSVRFNGYGNLETVSIYQLESEAVDYAEETLSYISNHYWSYNLPVELEEIFKEEDEEEDDVAQ